MNKTARLYLNRWSAFCDVDKETESILLECGLVTRTLCGGLVTKIPRERACSDLVVSLTDLTRPNIPLTYIERL